MEFLLSTVSFASSYSGLREMASAVNRMVTYWWRTEFADLANVYTLHDFVISTDMVQVAIERNLLLAKRRNEASKDHN